MSGAGITFSDNYLLAYMLLATFASPFAIWWLFVHRLKRLENDDTEEQ